MAELLRRQLGPRTVSAIALYIVLRMARRGERVIDEEKLAKLLFFALYTEPGPDGEPVLRENPPRLNPEMEFRIYLHGPYIRAEKLVDYMNKLVRALIGLRNLKGLYEENKKIIVTAAITEYIDLLLTRLADIIARMLGEKFIKHLDDWVIAKLGLLSPQHLTPLALQALYLETGGPPIKKAMVFNMCLDDYINMLYVFKSIRDDLARGKLHLDYELDEILE